MMSNLYLLWHTVSSHFTVVIRVIGVINHSITRRIVILRLINWVEMINMLEMDIARKENGKETFPAILRWKENQRLPINSSNLFYSLGYFILWWRLSLPYSFNSVQWLQRITQWLQLNIQCSTFLCWRTYI